ncbi:hypothetical protein FGO68_gene827 [Halteria grandinella]|uniref:protein-serine/threonine phosphatase n=1 Tax=Halteria grandinella TaxID=5974 RepID=A0A8J8NM11_HALGN|nr:hypothetical protein FGO68_gene827 [Halteria grandinella]
MGEYLSTPNREKKSEEAENGKLRYGLSAMQGWRRSMEDAHIANLDIGDGVAIFGVFDGHGGGEVSQYVAKHFIKELKKLESFKRKDYRLSLQECFMRMDTVMLTKEGKKELAKIAAAGRASGAGDSEDMYGMGDVMHAGCTANVVMITKAEILCANAGDSRASEKRRIERANGFVEDSRVNGMLALSRSMGDFEYKTNTIMKAEDQVITAFPEISIEKITADCDFIVCACDGIWDCLTSQEAVNQVIEKMKKKKCKDSLACLVEELLDQILAQDVATSQGIGCDNMSCIVIEFKK